MKDNAEVKDKRLFERFQARFPAMIKDVRNEYGDLISVRNASASGIKINSKERMYVNDKIVLKIELPGSEKPLTFRGEVMWAKEGLNNIWEIGLRFLKIDFMQSARLYKHVSINFA